MPRYRLIPTGVPTSSDLQRTLTEMGLRNVEVHDAPVPLDDWIGRPTDVMADVVVRRKDLGASSDDMGFVRNAGGTFDALVSEIHLFRFDKKWFAELAQRSGVAVPDAGPRQFAESTSSPLPVTAASTAAAAQIAATARDDRQAERARQAAAEVLEKARRSQRVSQAGCLLFFLPVLPWMLIGIARGKMPDASMLFALWIAWGCFYLCGVIVVTAVRFRSRVREFAQRFPPGSEARAAAVAHLRSIAADQKSQAARVAARLLAQVEGHAAAARIRLHPPTPRGPGATKP